MAYLIDSGLSIAFNNTPTTATRSSGGSSGATSVVISTANDSIAYDQTITGTGFAPNTKVTSVSGTTINFSPAASANITGTITFSTTWYKLTDHNRDPINISTELIENQVRMANGKMRKYVVAQKNNISVSWKYVPSLHFKRDPVTKLLMTGDANQLTVDGNRSAAWLESFYQTNAGLPIYIKVVSSGVDSDISTAVIDPNSNTPANQIPAPGSLPASTFITAQDGFKFYKVFMSDFSKTIINRTQISDYVDMSIEFTEI
jgi:hypothetical protein